MWHNSCFDVNTAELAYICFDLNKAELAYIYACRPTEKATLPAAKYDAQEFSKLVKKLAPVSVVALLIP